MVGVVNGRPRLHRTPTSLPPTAARRSLYHARFTALQGGPGADSMRRPARCSDGSMASPQDCIEFAKQCERLASLCEDDPQLREHLIDLAREWMTMAEQNTADA